MELPHDILDWVLAVFKHWHGYVSGGAIAFALEYGERLWDWKPSKKWIVVILCIGFLFSIFSAWRDQYVARIVAEKQLEELKNPQFEITHGAAAVTKAVVGYEKATELRTMIILPVTVFNHGAPSVIREVRMSVKFPDGEELKGKPYLPKQAQIAFPGPKGQISFPTSSSLFVKGANPIPIGGQSDGFVMFEFPDGLLDKITQTSKSIDLVIFDVNMKPYPIRLPRNKVPTNEFTVTPGMLEYH